MHSGFVLFGVFCAVCFGLLVLFAFGFFLVWFGCLVAVGFFPNHIQEFVKEAWEKSAHRG